MLFRNDPHPIVKTFLGGKNTCRGRRTRLFLKGLPRFLTIVGFDFLLLHPPFVFQRFGGPLFLVAFGIRVFVVGHQVIRQDKVLNFLLFLALFHLVRFFLFRRCPYCCSLCGCFLWKSDSRVVRRSATGNSIIRLGKRRRRRRW